MKKRRNGEGTYGEKTINGYLYKFYRDVNGKYTYGKTLKEVDERLREKREKEKQESLASADEKLLTFGDYCLQWLYANNQITDGTKDDYESIINKRIKEFKDYDIGNKQCGSLTTEMFNSYFNELGNKYSKGSIEKVWTVVRQVLEYGVDQGKIPVLKLKDIKRPKEENCAVQKKEILSIDIDDLEALYKEYQRKTSRGTDYYGNASRVVIFIGYSGVRISEAIALRWVNVADDYSYVKIRESNRRITARDKNGQRVKDADGKYVKKNVQKTTKTENGVRTIPLPDRAQGILKALAAGGVDKNDFVFKTSNNVQYQKRTIERTLKRMLNNSDCKCKDYTPHSLRHGYGSILLRKGVDIKIVSELLGHSDVAFTYNVYISILKQDKIDAVLNVFNSERNE